MSTFLFEQIVFGPVRSRRLGLSLGINLLPVNRKICNFDCIYCECGLNIPNDKKSKLPTRTEVYSDLRDKLMDMKEKKSPPDVITFAGNGEPTLHPQFAGIIDDTIDLRNEFCPSAAISVLSNATMLHKPEIVDALKKVDQNILKLDSGLEETIKILNQPLKRIPINTLVNQFKQFKGELIIQSLFVKGDIRGKMIDNTNKEDLDAWIRYISEIKPKMVMIYTIDRDTPFKELLKIPVEKLHEIARMVTNLGIETRVSG